MADVRTWLRQLRATWPADRLRQRRGPLPPLTLAPRTVLVVVPGVPHPARRRLQPADQGATSSSAALALGLLTLTLGLLTLALVLLLFLLLPGFRFAGLFLAGLFLAGRLFSSLLLLGLFRPASLFLPGLFEASFFLPSLLFPRLFRFAGLLAQGLFLPPDLPRLRPGPARGAGPLQPCGPPPPCGPLPRAGPAPSGSAAPAPDLAMPTSLVTLRPPPSRARASASRPSPRRGRSVSASSERRPGGADAAVTCRAETEAAETVADGAAALAALGRHQPGSGLSRRSVGGGLCRRGRGHVRRRGRGRVRRRSLLGRRRAVGLIGIVRRLVSELRSRSGCHCRSICRSRGCWTGSPSCQLRPH